MSAKIPKLHAVGIRSLTSGRLSRQISLEQFGIDQEPKPEGLQHVKDEALGSVQEAAAKYVAIKEETKGPNETWAMVVYVPQESLSLNWIAAGHSSFNPAVTAAQTLLFDLGIGPAVVANRPFANGHSDIVDHEPLQLFRPTGSDVEMLVVLPRLAFSIAGSEKPHVPCGKHSAVTNWLSEEAHQPWNVEAADMTWFLQVHDLMVKFRRDSFIRVQMELPFVLQWQRGYGPIPLRAIVLKGMFRYFCPVTESNFDRPIRAKGIDNMNVV